MSDENVEHTVGEQQAYHIKRDWGSNETPEPLRYHQPGHPRVVGDEAYRAWREPLLPQSECDHGRTFVSWYDGLGGGVYQEQCLDCCAVVDSWEPEDVGHEPDPKKDWKNTAENEGVR